VKRSRITGSRRAFPALSGQPIRVQIRASLGPHLAATFIPRRLILLDAGVLAQHGEFERILIHEIFHFAWVRLGNPRRRQWEALIAAEWSGGWRGELGWSAEWRKNKLRPADRRLRTAAWRRYVCESFCDSAAWLWSGIAKHGEFTLAPAARRKRKKWLQREFSAGVLV
jgi:hypothetical protein